MKAALRFKALARKSALLVVNNTLAYHSVHTVSQYTRAPLYNDIYTVVLYSIISVMLILALYLYNITVMPGLNDICIVPVYKLNYSITYICNIHLHTCTFLYHIYQ